MQTLKVHLAPTGDWPSDHGKPCQTGPKEPMPAHQKITGDNKLYIYIFAFFCMWFFSVGFAGFF